MPPHAQFSPRSDVGLLRFVNRDPEPRREMEMIQGREKEQATAKGTNPKPAAVPEPDQVFHRDRDPAF
jgi:hypothetical protein